MSDMKAKLTYQGSLFWLIFWVIFFFPIALLLLATASSCSIDQKTYAITYEGSKFWLCFWAPICFPITIILLCTNGLSLTITAQE